MSSSTKVGKDTSLQGGVFFQTFRDLLKQREALDHQILRLQGHFFKMVEKNAKPGSISPSKKYVARMHNLIILEEAVRRSMIPGRKMNMIDILKAIKNNGLYHSKSKLFYTMVNNKLNKDPMIEKVSRGVFVLQKRSGRLEKVAM